MTIGLVVPMITQKDVPFFDGGLKGNLPNRNRTVLRCVLKRYVFLGNTILVNPVHWGIIANAIAVAITPLKRNIELLEIKHR